MSAGINQLAPIGATLALLVASAGLAQPTGESIPTDVDDRWIPSFAIRSGVTLQYMNSSAASHCDRGRPEESIPIPGTSLFVDRLACADPNQPDPGEPAPDPATQLYPPDPPVTPGLFDPNCPETPSPDGRRACLRPSVEGDDLAVTPFVGGSLELMTPRVGLLPGRPRLFVGGELLTLYAQERRIASEGSPRSLALPESAQTSQFLSGKALVGVGTTVTSQVQRVAFGARTGLAFPFEVRERRLWLKPSFGWFQYEVDYEGVIVAGIKPDPINNPNQQTKAFGMREVVFEASGSETFNGIGPGLELEMEVGRFGFLGVSLFLNFDAYWLLGDRTFPFTAPDVSCPAFDPMNPTAGCAPSTALEDPAGEPMQLEPVPGAHQKIFGFLVRPMEADTYDAEFEFSVDPIVYRGGLGIRFHWLGR